MSRIAQINEHGQSIWYDYIQRGLIWTGQLHAMVRDDKLGGVTSNPAIFEKAIGGSTDYEGAVTAAVRQGLDAGAIFEQIAITDIQLACDTLRSVFERTDRLDGYVSLEVSPHLANDTEATIEQALRLWREVGRDNLMVKVPATPAGIPAIERLIGEGLNINVTLLFAVPVYEQVFAAYRRGLETRAAKGLPVDHVASVASFFVSRIDGVVDKMLEERKKSDPSKAKEIDALMGKAAIANAKLAYRSYETMVAQPAWKALSERGAHPQRLLWASTSTKNPSYRDVLYVEELIGPETVNTVPEATYEAFNDHGEVATTLSQGFEEAQQILSTLEKLDVSLDRVAEDLLEDGVTKFADAFDKLLSTVERRRKQILGSSYASMEISGASSAFDKSLEALRVKGFVRDLWSRDASLFGSEDAGDPAVCEYMGWLDALDRIEDQVDDLERFGQELVDEGVQTVVLMGMGGSSLAPDVFARTFDRKPGRPELLVLDSTVPGQIAELEARLDLGKTIFIVSSKSGTTSEPLSFLAYFWDKLKDGHRFVAVTDPGSLLEEIAHERDFRWVFHGEPEIGGRYSALSCFGLVAAAVLGLDVRDVLVRARHMVNGCTASVPPSDNDGVRLGAWLGHYASFGRDKLTVLSTDRLAAFGAWLEQLVAESTGKRGKGIVPVDGEGLRSAYGEDRVFAYLVWRHDPSRPKMDQAVAKIRAAGHPIVTLELEDLEDLVQEMYRFEVATATAGAMLGINPFDQPNVQESKTFTKSYLEAYTAQGKLPEAQRERRLLEHDGIAIYADPDNAEALVGRDSLQALLRAHVGRASEGDYIALNAYVPMNEANAALLDQIRRAVGRDGQVATTVGYGPRFLHSTGQLHKGGPNTGVFVQITCDTDRDLPIPEQSYGFQTLVMAQAQGDYAALAKRERRMIRVHCKDATSGLETLAKLLG